MDFPQYRKYPTNSAFFKIESVTKFEELSIMGKRYSLLQFEAKIHPDRMRIADMLSCHNGHWETIEEEVYRTKVEWCKNELEAL